MRSDPMKLHALCSGELLGLEAFLAEHRAPLRWLERHGGLLAASRACRDGFHPFPGRAAARRPGSPLALAGLAPLRFVLEVLVGEKLLLSRRPDELRVAVHAPEDPVLELHRSLPRLGRSSRSGLVFALPRAIPPRSAPATHRLLGRPG